MLPLLPPACSFSGPPDDESLVNRTAVDLPPTHREAELVVALSERAAEDRGRHGLGPDRFRPDHVLLVDLRPGRRRTYLWGNPLAQEPTKGILVLPVRRGLARDGRRKRMERSGSGIGDGTSDRPGEDPRGLPREGRREPRVLSRSIAWLASLSPDPPTVFV
jgi:hypothetical protein